MVGLSPTKGRGPRTSPPGGTEGWEEGTQGRRAAGEGEVVTSVSKHAQDPPEEEKLLCSMQGLGHNWKEWGSVKGSPQLDTGVPRPKTGGLLSTGEGWGGQVPVPGRVAGSVGSPTGYELDNHGSLTTKTEPRVLTLILSGHSGFLRSR